MAKKYPVKKVVLYATNGDKAPLTSDDAKELIGWTEEPEGDDWGNEFVLKDKFGKKIRLLNNPSNRPFKRALSEKYAVAHLRKEWELNLETIVISQSGRVPQGQHRFVGFILAEQERQLDPAKWGDKELLYEVAIGFGVEDKDSINNSFDMGANRSLADVLYRYQDFDGDDKVQKRISSTLAGALRLVWIRAGGKSVSSAPHFPHQEAIKFFDDHKDILDSVKKVIEFDEGEGGERLFHGRISLPYAAGLHYLMTKTGQYNKADEFWSSLATMEGLTAGSPISALSKLLINKDSGSGQGRDNIILLVIKAYNLLMEDEKTTTKKLQLRRKKNDDGKLILSEYPRLGGLDVEPNMDGKLTTDERHILNSLNSSKDVEFEGVSSRGELTYESLANNCGLTKSKVSRLLSEESTLVEQGLVSTSVYDNDGQDTPALVSITDKGKASLLNGKAKKLSRR